MDIPIQGVHYHQLSKMVESDHCLESSGAEDTIDMRFVRFDVRQEEGGKIEVRTWISMTYGKGALSEANLKQDGLARRRWTCLWNS